MELPTLLGDIMGHYIMSGTKHYLKFFSESVWQHLEQKVLVSKLYLVRRASGKWVHFKEIGVLVFNILVCIYTRISLRSRDNTKVKKSQKSIKSQGLNLSSQSNEFPGIKSMIIFQESNLKDQISRINSLGSNLKNQFSKIKSQNQISRIQNW